MAPDRQVRRIDPMGCVWKIILGLLLLASPASAIHAFAQGAPVQQGQVLPPIDLHIIMDKAFLLYPTGGPQPGAAIADALVEALKVPSSENRNTFLRPGDRLFVSWYGLDLERPTVIDYDGTFEKLAGPVRALASAPDRAKNTDFDELFTALADIRTLKEDRASRLKVVILVSDFLHDTNTYRGGFCQSVEDINAGKIRPGDRGIAQFRTVQTIATPNAYPIILAAINGAFNQERIRRLSTNQQYRNCVADYIKINPVIKSLYEAADLIVDDTQFTANPVAFSEQLAKRIQEVAPIPPIVKSGRVTLQDGLLRAELFVRNPSSLPNAVNGIALFDTPTATRPLVPTKGLNRPVTVEPKDDTGERIVLAFEGDEASRLLSAPALYAAARGTETGDYISRIRTKLSYQDPHPLKITAATPRPTSSGDAIDLTITVENTGGARKRPVQVRFQVPGDTEAGLGRTGSVENARTIPPLGTETFTIPVPPLLQKRLQQDASFNVIVDYRPTTADDQASVPGLRLLATEPFPIEGLQVAALVIEQGRLVKNPNQVTGYELNLQVHNPNADSELAIGTLQVIGFIDGEEKPLTITANPDDVVGAKRTLPVRYAFPQDARSFLTDPTGIRVRVIEKSYNLVSEPVTVEVDKPRPLEVDAANGDWKSPRIGELVLTLPVVNPDVVPNHASLVRFFNGEGTQIQEAPPSAGLVRLPPDGSRGSVRVELSEGAVTQILDVPELFVAVVDVFGQESRRERLAPYVKERLLIDGEVRLQADAAGGVEVFASVRNPGNFGTTLRVARLLPQGSAAGAGAALPLEPVLISAGVSQPVSIPVPREILRRISPHRQNQLEILDDASINQTGRFVEPTTRSIERLVSNPPSVYSTPVWDAALDGPVYLLVLPMRNAAQYTQYVTKVVFRRDDRRGPGYNRSVPFAQPVELRSNGGHASVPIPFEAPLQKEMLLGESFNVCLVVETDAVDSENSQCDDRWHELVPQPPPPLSIEAQRSEPGQQRVIVTVANNTNVVNVLTALVLLPKVPPPDLEESGLAGVALIKEVQEDPFLPGERRDVSVLLSFEEWSRFYADFEARTGILDRSVMNSLDDADFLARAGEHRVRLETFTYSQTHSLRAQRQPHDDSTLIESKFVIDRGSNVPLNDEIFEVWLANVHGGREPGTLRTIPVSFGSNLSAPVRVVWTLAPSRRFADDWSANIRLANPGDASGPRTIDFGLQQWTLYWWYFLCPFVFVLSLVTAIASGWVMPNRSQLSLGPAPARLQTVVSLGTVGVAVVGLCLAGAIWLTAAQPDAPNPRPFYWGLLLLVPLLLALPIYLFLRWRADRRLKEQLASGYIIDIASELKGFTDLTWISLVVAIFLGLFILLLLSTWLLPISMDVATLIPVR